MKNEVENSYANTPYTSRPIALSSPLRLEAIATLLGANPTPASKARVLEIGCSFGGNLVYFALNNPNATCLGIDISEVQITGARKIAKELDLKNLSFICADICDIARIPKSGIPNYDELGEFDYIIAHGVYSWVDDSVKDALMALCQKHLSPNGIAFISYNTYPGWKQRDILRDLMLFSSAHLKDDKDKLARAKSVVRSFVSYAQKLDDSSVAKAGFSKALLEHGKDISETYDDFYLLHDHLERSNDPRYLHEFVAHAGRFGLCYLADSALSPTFISTNNTLLALPNLAERIKSEQYADFLCLRSFRASLLAKQDLAKHCSLLGKFDENALKKLYFRGKFEINENFVSAKKASFDLSTAPIAKVFNSHFPDFISLDELSCELDLKAQSLIASLLQMCFIGTLDIAAQKVSHPSYKAGKTRLKTSAKKYLEYFASAGKAQISLAGYFGQMIEINESYEAKAALFFDGKNDIEQICELFMKLLADLEIGIQAGEQKGFQKSRAFMLEYTKKLESVLQNAGFFEEF